MCVGGSFIDLTKGMSGSEKKRIMFARFVKTLF